MYRNDRAAQQGHGKRRETVVHVRSQDVGVALLAESHHLLGGVRHPQSGAVTERGGPEERVDSWVDVFQDRPFNYPVPHRGDVQETFPILLGDHHPGQVRGPERPHPELLGELLQSFLNPSANRSTESEMSPSWASFFNTLSQAQRSASRVKHPTTFSSSRRRLSAVTTSPPRHLRNPQLALRKKRIKHDEISPSKLSTIPHGNSSPN